MQTMVTGTLGIISGTIFLGKNRAGLDEKMRVRVVILLVFCVFGYMIAGGFIFNALEKNHERKLRETTRDYLNEFLEKHPCVRADEVDKLIRVAITAYDSGILAVNNVTTSSTTWDVPNSIFFAATVITTVGYGHLAPKTVGGHAFTIPYAIWGIPICLVMLAGIGSKFNNIADTLEKKISVCNRRTKSGKLVRILTLVLVGTLLFLVLPAFSFMLKEDWSYGEAIYYCFVTLTTIGFGDFVAGVNSQKEYGHLYRLGRTLWLFLGLAWLSTVISAKQSTIQEFINKEEKRLKSLEHQKALGKMFEETPHEVDTEDDSESSDVALHENQRSKKRRESDNHNVTSGNSMSAEIVNGTNSPEENVSLLQSHSTAPNGALVQCHKRYENAEKINVENASNQSQEESVLVNSGRGSDKNKEDCSLSSVT